MNNDNQTPFHLSVRHNHPIISEYLLDNGANGF